MTQTAETTNTEEVIDLEKRKLIREGGLAIGYLEGKNVVLDAAFFGCEAGRRLIRLGHQIHWRPAIAQQLEQKEEKGQSAQVRVYQLKEQVDPSKKFISYERLYQQFGGICETDYKTVFDGKINAKEPEEIYELLNEAVLPKGYRGHRLTVSDVVVCASEGTVRCWYVDMDGFVPIVFEKEKD